MRVTNLLNNLIPYTFSHSEYYNTTQCLNQCIQLNGVKITTSKVSSIKGIKSDQQKKILHPKFKHEILLEKY